MVGPCGVATEQSPVPACTVRALRPESLVSDGEVVLECGEAAAEESGERPSPDWAVTAVDRL